MDRRHGIPPTEDGADEPRPYADAIGQLMAAAERTRDVEAWLTLTALAEMFVRLDQRRRASESGYGDLDDRSSPAANQPS